MNDQNILELTSVCKTYSQARDATATVLSDISLTVPAGEAMAIVGPSGSGKSTLLNLIGALDRPTSGTVRLDGRDLTSLNASELAEIRRTAIGFVFQQHHLLPQCTVLENVLLPALASGNVGPELSTRAIELLKRVGLDDRLHHKPTELSGGQQQRVAIARALVNEPALLLADESTGNLDSQTALEILDLFDELHADGMTILLVTHEPSVGARTESRLQLKDGHIDQVIRIRPKGAVAAGARGES